MKRFLKLGCFGFIGLIAILLIALKFLMPEEIAQLSAQEERFASENPDQLLKKGDVFAAFAGPEDADTTVFIVHGSPGGWNAGATYLLDEELTKTHHVISFDRPGYGKSERGETVGSFSKQCEKLAVWAENRPGRKIWLGHSFGAPIVAQMAVDRPDLVDGLILSASAMDPKLEPVRWFHKLGDTAVGRFFLSPEWKVTNEECIAFADELKLLKPKLAKITCPVFILHAKDDSLATFAHAEWTADKLSGTKPQIVEFEKGDHFILWNRILDHKKAIFDLSEK